MSKLTIGSPWRIYTREIFGLSSGHPHGLCRNCNAMLSVGDPEKYCQDFYDSFMKGGGAHHTIQ